MDSTPYGQFCSEARRPGGRITTTTPQHCRSSSVASKSSIGELVVALTLNTYHTLLDEMIMVMMAVCYAAKRNNLHHRKLHPHQPYQPKDQTIVDFFSDNMSSVEEIREKFVGTQDLGRFNPI